MDGQRIRSRTVLWAAGVSASPAAGENTGVVAIYYGRIAGHLGLADSDARIEGVAAHDGMGRSVAGCPDMDGDGADELLVGANGESTNGDWAGAAYLFYGGR